MSGFIQGEDRSQATLFPERPDDYVAEDSAVRVIDVFIDELDLSGMGFKTQPNDTGRPAYHPATMLKLFVYGYLNRVHSSRRLEREAQRNVELMWLTGRLAPDFKTIADFRKDNGGAIRLVCRQFVILCRNLNLFANAFVAIDGSKFKAVNNRDRNFTRAKMKRRIAEVDATIDRYLHQLAEADQQEPAEDKTQRLEDKIAALKQEMARLKKVEARMLSTPGQQISLTDPDARSMNHRGSGVVGYNVQTAVDTEHHLIVAHEVTRWTRPAWWRTAAIIATWNSRPAKRLASLPTFPTQAPRPTKPRASSTAVCSATSPQTTSTNARRGSGWLGA
jgi:transposase